MASRPGEVNFSNHDHGAYVNAGQMDIKREQVTLAANLTKAARRMVLCGWATTWSITKGMA